MRLDKYICECTRLTRTQAKEVIKHCEVSINNQIVKDPSIHINSSNDTVYYKGNSLNYKEYRYYVLNKPAGIITATTDSIEQTVMDLLDDSIKGDIFPVGRLDKDTEGLLLLTNDGELSHRLLSSKYHIDKCYSCKLEKNVTYEDIESLEKGINIGDEIITLPAIARLIDQKTVELTIFEGRYHQVKRMFQALCNKVIGLKRISFGPLILKDFNLRPGEYIELNDEQVKLLKEYKYDETDIR